VSAEEIIRDRKIRKRESFLNLSKGSYLWSKIIIMFVLSAVQTLTFVLIGNAVLGIKGMYIDYWLVLFTTSCFANMLGLNISSAFNSAVTIYILIPFLIIPQLLLAGVVVKFDKLNPVLAKQGGVPVVGELMASRWAYEALAVNQFKENKYEKNFYKFDKKISIASYKKDYWRQKVQAKINKIENGLREGKSINEFEPDLNLLKSELTKEEKFINMKCSAVDSLDTQHYNSSVGRSVINYLEELKERYNKIDKKARNESDALTLNLKKKLDIVALKDDYENESLTQLVKNANDLSGEKSIEKDGRFIQTTDPVFADPTESKMGRAHFYAPTKNLFGKYVPTFWFNICVIWMMSIVLMITLYYDVFKRILDFFGNLNFFTKKRS
jgi:hypothetical protein